MITLHYMYEVVIAPCSIVGMLHNNRKANSLAGSLLCYLCSYFSQISHTFSLQRALHLIKRALLSLKRALYITVGMLQRDRKVEWPVGRRPLRVYILWKESCIITQKSLTIVKRALYITVGMLQRDRELESPVGRRPLRAYILSKEPYIITQKSLNICQKSPSFSRKSPVFFQKSLIHYSGYAETWLDSGMTCKSLLTSRVNSLKSAIDSHSKSPTICQKGLISSRNSPVHYRGYAATWSGSGMTWGSLLTSRVYSLKRALHYHAKEPQILSKQPSILSKEPCILSKEPYVLSKNPIHYRGYAATWSGSGMTCGSSLTSLMRAATSRASMRCHICKYIQLTSDTGMHHIMYVQCCALPHPECRCVAVFINICESRQTQQMHHVM